MQSVSRKRYLDWKDITEAVSSLAVSIESYNVQFQRILGISRGGLIPATMLAHQLGIQEVSSLQLRSYSDTYSQESVVPWNWDELAHVQRLFNQPECLIVDDLHDTGKTLEYMGEQFPNATMATLYWKNVRGCPAIGFPGKELPNRWIVFPWEKDPADEEE